MKGREKAYEGYRPKARYGVVWCLLTRGEGIRDRLLNSKGWELTILVDLPRPRTHALPGHPHPRSDECNMGLHRGLLLFGPSFDEDGQGFFTPLLQVVVYLLSYA